MLLQGLDTPEAGLAIGAVERELPEMHSFDMLSEVPFDEEGFVTCGASVHRRVGVFMDDANVLVHVVLEMKTFGAVGTKESEGPVDELVATKATGTQVDLVANLTLVHLDHIMRSQVSGQRLWVIKLHVANLALKLLFIPMDCLHVHPQGHTILEGDVTRLTVDICFSFIMTGLDVGHNGRGGSKYLVANGAVALHQGPQTVEVILHVFHV